MSLHEANLLDWSCALVRRATGDVQVCLEPLRGNLVCQGVRQELALWRDGRGEGGAAGRQLEEHQQETRQPEDQEEPPVPRSDQ